MESNITAKSAIECLKKHKEERRNDFIVLMGAVATAIEALKKQIPKKPIWGADNMDTIDCPRCSYGLDMVDAGEYMQKHDYCPKCGQALDWSDTI